MVGIPSDINETKQAEAALRESESMLRSFFDSAGAMRGIVELEQDDILHISDNAISAAFFGETRESMRNKRASELGVPPETVRLWLTQYLKSQQTDEAVSFECQHKSINGERWLSATVSCLGLSPAERPRFAYVVVDVTERKLAEAALKETEGRYQDLVEHSNDMIYTHDLEGVCFFANQQSSQLLGYAPSEMVGRKLSEFLAPEVRNQFDNYLKRILTHGQASGLMLVQTKTGARLVCEYDNSLRANGKSVPVVRCIARDVTERSRAERTLREAEQKYRGIFENAGEGIFQTTPAGGFITANPALARMLGFDSPEELIREHGNNARKHCLDPERREEYQRLLEQRGVVSGFEYQGLRKDGSKIWLSDSVRAARDHSGKLLYYEGIAEDITERKRAEAALHESEERFRQLSEAAFEAIIVHGQETILEVNQSFCRMYGYEREEVIGKSVLDLALPELREQLRQIVRSGDTGPYESPALRKDGSVFNAEVAGKPIHYQGRIARVAAIRDITEKMRNDRRQAAQYAVTRVLAESATLAEATPQLLRVICESLRWKMGEFWSAGDSSNILRCVETWHVPALDATSVVEASREIEFAPGVGLPGRVWQSGQPAWIPDLTADPGFVHAAIMSKVGLRGAVAFPILLGNHTLGVMLFFSRRIPEVDEDLLKMLSSIGSQIGQFTERKRAEEALRQAEFEYRNLVESVQAIVWRTDARTFQFSFVSKEAETLLGYPVERWTSDPLFWKDHIHIDDREWALSFCAKATEEKRDHAFEYRMIAADGGVVWLRDIVRVVVEHDRVKELVGVMTDVTERKRAEDKINDQLEELRRWQQVTLDREDRLQELKREVNELAQRLGEPARYASQTASASSKP